MLNAEALVGLACVALALLALWRMNALTVREPNEIAN